MALRLSPAIEVDALGFDLDHTLGFDDRLELRTMVRYAHEAAERRGATPNDGAIEHRVQELLVQSRAGVISIDQAVTALLHDYIPLADARAAAARWRQETVNAARTSMRPAAGVRECIARLEARSIPLAILTNGWSPLQEAKAESLGLAHVPILVSEKIGALKPSPEAFDALLERLGTSAKRTAYVGDDFNGDVLGARACSLAAVWVAEYEPTAELLRALPDGVVTIRSLEELAR